LEIDEDYKDEEFDI